MKTTLKTMKLVPILVSFAASAVFAASLSVPISGCDGDKKKVETKQSKEETSDKARAEKEVIWHRKRLGRNHKRPKVTPIKNLRAFSV